MAVAEGRRAIDPLRGCMTAIRAEPFEPGSSEMTALELFLAQRAAGLPIETPAVRP